MNYSNELKKRLEAQHCLGCRVAIAVNLLWGLCNYFLFDENQEFYLGINVAVALVITVAMLLRKSLKLSYNALGLIPMLTTLTAFAFIYNTIELNTFQKLTYMHVAVFVGSGMFLLWHWVYSLISVAYALAINILFYILWSPLSLDEYLSHGALMVAIVAFFMIVAIQSRFTLVIRELEAREALRKSEEKSRLLVTTAMDGIITIDQHQNVTLFNPAAEEIFGFTSDEIYGHPIKVLIPEEGRNDYSSFVEGFIQNTAERKRLGEKRAIYGQRKNGEVFPLEIAISKLNYDGSIMFNTIVRDVSEQVKAKNELIQAEKAATHSRELQSTFLSNMSHEIRTPMNGILGITRILQKSDLNDEQRHYLNAISRSSENLMVIINDILDFSKIEAGKILIEQTEFNLEEELNSLQEVLLVKAEEKGIYFVTEIESGTPTTLLGDPVRINQVLLNLIGNAIKFTERGGVKVRVHESERKDNISAICFEVEDTGIGIPKDKKDSIFQSFTQASASTTRTHGGTGLGLTISKNLVQLMGGQLELDSAGGKGSTFKFTLHLEINSKHSLERRENQLIQACNDELLNRLEGLHILLVEDHPINQLLAIKVLEDWNFKVDLAENGKIALDMIGKSDYDLVLMDISMPEMDGYQATKEIRTGRYNNNPQIPIIAMTASALIGENQKAFKAGMNDYLSKPFDPQVLLTKISRQIITPLKKVS